MNCLTMCKQRHLYSQLYGRWFYSVFVLLIFLDDFYSVVCTDWLYKFPPICSFVSKVVYHLVAFFRMNNCWLYYFLIIGTMYHLWFLVDVRSSYYWFIIRVITKLLYRILITWWLFIYIPFSLSPCQTALHLVWWLGWWSVTCTIRVRIRLAVFQFYFFFLCCLF